MCKKCQEGCDTCRELLQRYNREDLGECDNCGHLFLHDDLHRIVEEEEDTVLETFYCTPCYFTHKDTHKRENNA